MNQYSELLKPLSSMFAAQPPQHWADFGCDNGRFTFVLAGILPAGSHIFAIDRKEQSISLPKRHSVSVTFQKTDFETGELILPPLQGIMLANSFHYIANKKEWLKKIEPYFYRHKQIILVEYDTDIANEWVPYPVSFNSCKNLFTTSGYSLVKKINCIPSIYGGDMYAAFIH